MYVLDRATGQLLMGAGSSDSALTITASGPV
jgi:hypothetical protein